MNANLKKKLMLLVIIFQTLVIIILAIMVFNKGNKNNKEETYKDTITYSCNINLDSENEKYHYDYYEEYTTDVTGLILSKKMINVYKFDNKEDYNNLKGNLQVPEGYELKYDDKKYEITSSYDDTTIILNEWYVARKKELESAGYTCKEV